MIAIVLHIKSPHPKAELHTTSSTAIEALNSLAQSLLMLLKLGETPGISLVFQSYPPPSSSSTTIAQWNKFISVRNPLAKIAPLGDTRPDMGKSFPTSTLSGSGAIGVFGGVLGNVIGQRMLDYDDKVCR